MSYDTLPYSTMEPPFFQENRSNPQSFRREDLMDIESSWIQNIDPLLRQSQMGSPDFGYSQDIPQQPLQRFITEPGRALFTTVPNMAHFDSCPRPPYRAFEPVSVYPQASRTRMISPSPSQELSSNCSSARSPATETDWYHDGYYSSQGQDDYTLPNTSHATSQNFSDVWSPPQILSGHPTGYPCVNLSDVQAFADPQEIKFETDETYADYAIQASESGSHKLASHISHYRDEGLGSSIRDAASPQAVSIQASNNDNTSTVSDADIDAEGDVDVETNGEIDTEAEIDSELLPQDGEVEEEGEPSDTEYTPRPSTATRANAPAQLSPTLPLPQNATAYPNPPHSHLNPLLNSPQEVSPANNASPPASKTLLLSSDTSHPRTLGLSSASSISQVAIVPSPRKMNGNDTFPLNTSICKLGCARSDPAARFLSARTRTRALALRCGKVWW
ncbi:hypothetical protein H4I96_04108 [Botrytis cinerea]